MSTQFISPVGRLVQGSMTLHPKMDLKGQPVSDDKGQPVNECFLAIAIRKDDPQLGTFYQLFDQQARASFPHLFPNGGACANPKFAWKIQDGDGVDSSGQSVANKPGHAGHYIFKMATRFAPRCYHYGKYDPTQQIQNPDDVIKKGFYIRVSGTIDGNGVQPGNAQAVPGLYVSPNLVELVAFGEEIVSGPDASKVFGGSAITALPAGASTTPLLPAATNGLTPPGLPGIGGGTPAIGGGIPGIGGGIPAIGGGIPGIGGGTPAIGGGIPGIGGGIPAIGGGIPGLPSQPGNVPGLLPPVGVQQMQQPQFQMQPSAQGATREQLHGLGWTDDMLIQQGHMVRVA